jgi:pantoate--beta-alanine ligase
VKVIERMALDLALPTTVIALPTVREDDGLALSSRNARLTPEARAAAPVLRKALLAAHAAWEGGTTTANQLRDVLWETVGAEPLASIDYVSVADAETLAEIEVVDRPALLSLAVRFEGVRLIDNERLG